MARRPAAAAPAGRPLGRVRVVGRSEPVELYELLGLKGDATTPDEEAIACFERAVAEFARRDFDAAATTFEIAASSGTSA